MITLAQARDRVEAEIRSRQSNLWPGDDFQIADDDTLEREWGWVFFYQSRLWMETGESRYRSADNGPMIVNRFDGTIHSTGTAHEPDYYITRYETEYERDRLGWCLVLIELSIGDPEHLQALRETLDLNADEVRSLNRRLPSVVMTGPRVEMVHFAEVLTTAGIRVETRRA
ncbi:MAG: hypothetical protein GY725_12300 [bacterium]|nr:hypothetical protein [bacterium]